LRAERVRMRMTSTLCDMLLSRLTFAVLIAASAAEEEQSACMSAPCQNGGMCRSEAGTYTCTCPVGVIGVNCETRVMDGMPCTCKNGVAAAQQCNARMPSRCMSCDAGYYLFGGKCEAAGHSSTVSGPRLGPGGSCGDGSMRMCMVMIRCPRGTMSATMNGCVACVDPTTCLASNGH
jgi:hypothetical protein